MSTAYKIEEAIVGVVRRGGKPACVILTKAQLEDVWEEYGTGGRDLLDLSKSLALRFCGLPVAVADDGYVGPMVAAEA